jgi:hypothetical protein
MTGGVPRGPPGEGYTYALIRFLSYSHLAPLQGPLQVSLCSTTSNVMLHYMSKNAYRSSKKQLSVVLDVDLIGAVKCAAADGGLSVSEFVRSVLAREVGCDVGGSGFGDREVFGASGGVVGQVSVAGSGSGTISGTTGRRTVVVEKNISFPAEGNTGKPDWDAILTAGAKPIRQQPVIIEIDPIEDIA